MAGFLAYSDLRHSLLAPDLRFLLLWIARAARPRGHWLRNLAVMSRVARGVEWKGVVVRTSMVDRGELGHRCHEPLQRNRSTFGSGPWLGRDYHGGDRRSSLRASIPFFFQAEDGIRDVAVTGVQTCALPI